MSDHINIETTDNTIFITLTIKAKLTHKDYQTLTPMIDSALEDVTSPRVQVFLDATGLTGWEVRAMWDDFMLGLKYRKAFEKISIYGNKKWLQLAAKIGSWFITGEINYFEHKSDASAWLNK